MPIFAFARALPPASAITRRMPSTTTSTGLLSTAPRRRGCCRARSPSIRDPVGVAVRPICRTRPNRSATGSWRRACSRGLTIDPPSDRAERSGRHWSRARCPCRATRDAVWADRCRHGSRRVGVRRETAARPASCAPGVDPGDGAAGADARRALGARRSTAFGAAEAGLGDVQVAAVAELQMARAVEPARDRLTLARRPRLRTGATPSATTTSGQDETKRSHRGPPPPYQKDVGSPGTLSSRRAEMSSLRALTRDRYLDLILVINAVLITVSRRNGMAIVRWEPLRELSTLQNEMNRLFGTPSTRRPNGGTLRRWMPAMDLIEGESTSSCAPTFRGSARRTSTSRSRTASSPSPASARPSTSRARRATAASSARSAPSRAR